MTYLMLFIEFFKVGLFTVGGGLATVPFLYEIAEKYPWFTAADVADMIAISESTPGPIGINMATYAGYNAGGLLGSITATLGIILPEIIIVLIIAKVLTKFQESRIVNAAFYGIRPTVTALVSVACFEVLKLSVLRWDAFLGGGGWAVLVNVKALLFFVLALFLIRKYKKHPIVYIGMGALVGLLVQF
ncbi:MAG: chromate transporter [Oscillospiraceae bacterium]